MGYPKSWFKIHKNKDDFGVSPMTLEISHIEKVATCCLEKIFSHGSGLVFWAWGNSI